MMPLSGYTPLIRARSLERMCGISRIHLKLEGSNVAKNFLARVAEMTVKDAEQSGNRRIIARGETAYLQALSHAAAAKDVELVIACKSHENWVHKRYSNTIRFKLRDDERFEDLLRNYADEAGGYAAFEGAASPPITNIAQAAVVAEIIRKRNGSIDTVYSRFSHREMLTGLYDAFYENVLNGTIEAIPTLNFAALDTEAEPCENYFSTGRFEESENECRTRLKAAKQSFLFNSDKLRKACDALKVVKGELKAVTVDELSEAAQWLRKHEQLSISSKEAHPLAAFLKDARSGELEDGHHVIILNDAASDVKIRRLESVDEISIERLLSYTQTWLAEYGDSEREAKEALEKAIETGHVLLAFRQEVPEGIAVLVRSGFDVFIPRYHLAYIGTAGTKKGHGVGTQLLEQAIELCEGRLSLHVDLDNNYATRLYRKMGFDHAYNRMIYRKKD